MKVEKPWGYYEVLVAEEDHWLKRLVVLPGSRLSLQSHALRAEFWYPLNDGGRGAFGGRREIDLTPKVTYIIPAGMKHRLVNSGHESLTVIEWAVGQPDEADIVRHEDDYGR